MDDERKETEQNVKLQTPQTLDSSQAGRLSRKKTCGERTRMDSGFLHSIHYHAV